MSKVLERKMFAKTAKKFAKGGEVTPQEPVFDMEAGMVPRSQRERMASELLGRDLGYSLLAQGDRPMLTRPTATGGGIPMAMQPQQAPVAAQMQQLQQAGMLPGFADGGPVEVPSMWTSIRETLGNAIGLRGRNEPLFSRGSGSQIGSAPVMNNPEPMENPDFRLPPGATSIPTTPQQDSLASRLAARRAAEAQRMVSEEEAIQKRNAAQTEVFRSPQGQEAMDLMTQGRILNDPALYQKGRDALKALTETSYQTTGAVTGPVQTGGFTPAEPLPSVAPMRSESAEVERARRAEEPKKETTKTPPPSPPPPPRDERKTNLEAIKASRSENAWLALMQAGLAIAGGRSPNAITNIGQGGQAGLASFMALEQQRRRDEDAAVRRDIAEKEYRLQEQRFQAQQPLLAAQAAYWQSRPAMDAQRLAGQQAVARQRAATEAGRLWKEETKGNSAYIGKSEDQLKIQRDIFIKRETDRLTNAYLNDILYGSPGQSRAPAAPEE